MSGFVIAASRGLLCCHACGLVSRPAGSHANWSCPRCLAHLHFRKPNSIGRTWALLIAAYLLYIPANILPIMQTSSLFESQVDTIMSGVIYLWTTGSWLVAIIVFIASIVVPLVKLIILSLLLILVQSRAAGKPLWRSRLYRLITFVGRWSMLDIFVAALLIELVQIQSIAMIKVGPGILAFGALVVTTMLASVSFDPRLIWDVAQRNEPSEHV